jgi:hypothetical protein
MRLRILCLSLIPFVGCAKSDDRASATPVTLASFAGSWQVTASNEAGDSVLAYQIVATGDPSGWRVMLPNRPPTVQTSVVVSGDSVVSEAGPFESALRPGVQVRSHAVLRLQGDQLVGYTIAHYDVKTADSVVRLNVQGTRMP